MAICSGVRKLGSMFLSQSTATYPSNNPLRNLALRSLFLRPQLIGCRPSSADASTSAHLDVGSQRPGESSGKWVKRRSSRHCARLRPGTRRVTVSLYIASPDTPYCFSTLFLIDSLSTPVHQARSRPTRQSSLLTPGETTYFSTFNRRFGMYPPSKSRSRS